MLNRRLYEDEVEHYVRTRMLADARLKPHGIRVLAAREDDRLVAVAAHAMEYLVFPDDTYYAARLQVLAISIADQGKVLEDGARLADVLIATLIADALEHVETDLITGIVASENRRSCCSRG
jgi:hypothetical protein